MRYFYHILFFVILGSFLLGMFKGNSQSYQPIEPVRSANNMYDKKLTDVPVSSDFEIVPEPDSEGLPSCSEVNTMPCTASPPNPLKDKLDKQVVNNYKLFKKNEAVTCIYPLVRFRVWSDGAKEEYIENTGLVCKVLKASEEYPDLEPNYQHLQVDCTKDMTNYNAVIGHKLNAVRWMSSTDCYHFVRQQ